MKIVKAVLISLLMHLYIQIDILLQIKAYDSNSDIFNWLTIILPIIFAVAVYFTFKALDSREFWMTVISFVVIYAVFIVSGSRTDYFKWLFNLMVYYDELSYEIGINAMLDGLAHTVGFIVSGVTYLIKNR